MKDILRIVSIVLFVATLFVPVNFFIWLRDETVLLVVGTIAIFTLILWDLYVGVFLLLAILICLYRIHVNQLNVFGWISSKEDGNLLRTKSLFTTQEHLQRIQTNVFDKEFADKEMIGITGVYGEQVYGAQGQGGETQTLPGYDNSKVVSIASDNYPLK